MRNLSPPGANKNLFGCRRSVESPDLRQGHVTTARSFLFILPRRQQTGVGTAVSGIASVLLAGILLCFSPASSSAVQWVYHHPSISGTLTVRATKDCTPIGSPLFQGYVMSCHLYKGAVPKQVKVGETDVDVNDIQFELVANTPEQDTLRHKLALPTYNQTESKWYLKWLGWLWKLIKNKVILPLIKDSTTGGQNNLHAVVDLNAWLANPRPLQATYNVVNGECPDLPGFLIGTTPIVFTPDVGPEENPFQTTRFTGLVDLAGELTLEPTLTVPAVTKCSLIILALLLVSAGTLFICRHQWQRASS